MATLTFYYSTMASGKSTMLLQLNHSLIQKGFKPLLLKPVIDNRDEDQIKSRIGISQKCFFINKDNIEREFEKKIIGSTHILIDEAQFLNREQIISLAKIVDYRNINVSCFGLRTDFSGKLFEGSSSLFAFADNLIEIPLISSDGNKTILHIKYVNNIAVFDGESIEVGGDDLYNSVSRKEWLTEYFKEK